MEYSDLVTRCANSGWYISRVLLIGLPGRIKEHRNLDLVFCDMIEESWDGLWERIFNSVSKRKKILEEAKICHEKGLYAASIHIFLSQVDGISIDKYNSQFFKNKSEGFKQKSCPELSYVQKDIMSKSLDDLKFTDVINYALINAHNDMFEFNYSSMNMRDFSCESDLPIPNRHGVFHGYHQDYPTKINSLKCFSLLLFMSDLYNGENVF